jgi:RimJ/RimL family protein N-acetyltransferase
MNMIPIEAVKGDGVLLRPYRTEDADDVVAGCADPVTQRYLPRLPSPYTREDALSWITEGAPGTFAAGGAGFAIADPETDRVVGGIGIVPLRPEERTAEIGYWVSPAARGRGVATAACRALTAQAFAHGLERLELRTEPENALSQRVALAAGYTREGKQRNGGLDRDGNRYDLIVLARLATDPADPTPRLLPDLPGGQLTDGVVTVRPLRAADTEDTYRLRQLPDVVETSVPPEPPGRAHIAEFCARAESAWLQGNRADFTIRDAATGAYAGEIGLFYHEPRTQQAMIGYSLAPEWRGRGYMTRAARLVSRWAFTEAGIQRIIAGTAPGNEGSQRVLARAGFQREGYQHSRLPGANGTRIDDILWALLPGQLTEA